MSKMPFSRQNPPSMLLPKSPSRLTVQPLSSAPLSPGTSSSLQNPAMISQRRGPSGLNATPISPLPPSPITTSPSAKRELQLQHLLSSPLPSPALPSIIPRHGKKLFPAWPRRMVRVFVWVVAMTALWYSAYTLLRSNRAPAAVSYLSQDGSSYEIVGTDELPDEPSPVVVTDQRGRSKWTISIPQSMSFPLKPVQYADICVRASNIAMHVANSKSQGASGTGHAGHFGYYHVDSNYMDIEVAQEHGLLPSQKNYLSGISGEDYATGTYDKLMSGEGAQKKKEICERSLTFVLETADAGLGKTLLALWMSFGLAVKEDRAFFIEDKNWAYGKYTTYFQPPPEQDCLPPPVTQRVPCPHHANHLVVSAATTTWTFGHAFNEYYEDGRKMETERLWKIFSFLRIGYEELFSLNDEDANYLSTRVEELNSAIRAKGGIEIGIHVRHGDLHPYEFQYQKSYIPLANYVDEARDILTEHYEDESGSIMENEMASKMIVASDDPAVYSSPELSFALKAQSQISLAGKTEPDEKNKDAHKSLLDDYTGWAGGFFKDVFWSLGISTSVPEVGGPAPSKKAAWKDRKPRGADVDDDDTHAHPPEQALRLRELVGRAYLLDLAVLGQTDSVVCSVSSAGCRLLAVMLGWEEAITNGHWVNVDGDWGWKGIIW